RLRVFVVKTGYGAFNTKTQRREESLRRTFSRKFCQARSTDAAQPRNEHHAASPCCAALRGGAGSNKSRHQRQTPPGLPERPRTHRRLPRVILRRSPSNAEQCKSRKCKTRRPGSAQGPTD